MAIISRAGYSRRQIYPYCVAYARFWRCSRPKRVFIRLYLQGNNHALEGFFNAIVLVTETGYAVRALVAMLLNLLITEEVEQDARLLEGNHMGAEDDDRNSGEDDIDAEKIRSSLLRLLLLKMKHNTMGYRA
jgi:uric acid-xanthine permease